MYLRSFQRTKDGKHHTYFALVESRRTERGPRQRIVAQLGELTEDQERRWHRTAVFHTRLEEGRELPLFLDAHDAPPSPDPEVTPQESAADESRRPQQFTPQLNLPRR